MLHCNGWLTGHTTSSEPTSGLTLTIPPTHNSLFLSTLRLNYRHTSSGVWHCQEDISSPSSTPASATQLNKRPSCFRFLEVETGTCAWKETCSEGSPRSHFAAVRHHGCYAHAPWRPNSTLHSGHTPRSMPATLHVSHFMAATLHVSHFTAATLHSPCRLHSTLYAGHTPRPMPATLHVSRFMAATLHASQRPHSTLNAGHASRFTPHGGYAHAPWRPHSTLYAGHASRSITLYAGHNAFTGLAMHSRRRQSVLAATLYALWRPQCIHRSENAFTTATMHS
ncbi:uncharacterized protein MYCFIDRAFT_179758 [Pseudocercospora fijiensis CIRAD86]|uniref:Uncharacterized protein n=1 Tax=Pseudocercospora fijiensis (strain CIRAD86) TaxID=383855 RepID=M2ZEE8_PSEFD|nr:uncharacterized protein MYCFIDRAFT_179758 [Pseudocercospora fijiensis CIRAD86]EME77509.1 hypothetical protein MYCFIDRAFT_179758 [Pseudocercospora fijiensis CIRAD86]